MRALALLTFVVSTSTFAACPNLVGKYPVCKLMNGRMSETSNVVMEQKIVNGYVNYTMSYTDGDAEKVDNYRADGKIRVTTEKDPDTGLVMRTENSAFCEGTSLIVKMKATMDGELFANLVVKINKENNKLIQTFSGESMGEPVTDIVVCE